MKVTLLHVHEINPDYGTTVHATTELLIEYQQLYCPEVRQNASTS